MREHTKVTVVMTTYNGKKFLLEMLDSLRKQTREIDELLIFDDQSKDSTVSFVEGYIREYGLQKWHIETNKENLGWERNFLNGLKNATGDIIFPCDQDDIWHLDKIEKMTGAFESNNDIWLLVSGYRAFSEMGGNIVGQQPVRTETQELVSKVVFDEKYYQILRPGCTMAFRKEIFPIFRQNWVPGTPHDAALWVIGALLRKLYLYDDTFIEYRRHNNNASKNISHVKKYKVNEIYRTLLVNEWYLNSEFRNDEIDRIVERCNLWCRYREKLLVENKLFHWFKLFPMRDFYLTKKKYIGDIIYFMIR